MVTAAAAAQEGSAISWYVEQKALVLDPLNAVLPAVAVAVSDKGVCAAAVMK